jgi:endo-1,4-beta-xylanase
MHTTDRTTRKTFYRYGLAILAIIIIAVAANAMMNNQEPNIPQAASTELNLLKGQWSYLPGATKQGTALQIQSLDRKIVNQDGSGGQPNPPINLYGTYLTKTSHFVVTAIVTRVQGNATIQLYGQPPIIADEFRIERKSVQVTLAAQTATISVWDGSKQTPIISRSFAYQLATSQRVAVEYQNNQILLTIGNKLIGKVTAKNIFSDGNVWFGFDATKSWLLQSLQAYSLDKQPVIAANAAATSAQPMKVNTQGIQQLAAKKRPGFKVGAAMAPGPAISDPQYASIAFGGDFGILTTENALKWQFVHPQPNVYSFQEGDALVALAKAHSMTVNGHTLVFGEANPRWVLDLPTTTQADKDKVKQVMIDHITTVMGHYKGKIATWDVVNEPLADYDTFDPSTYVLRRHKWYDAMGEDYIRVAFQTAHAADPSAKLFINEYGLEEDGDRWNAFLALVTRLKQEGVPIDGVGFQAHEYDASDKIPVPSLRAHIEQLAKIGLVSRISEMDVYPDDGVSLQAQQYANVFGTCLDEPTCISFTTWGISDRYDTYKDDNGNIAYGQDLLWDSNMQPTPAVSKIRSLLN